MASLKDLANRVKQYFNPQSNGGQNFWGNSKIAQGMGNFQNSYMNASQKIATNFNQPIARVTQKIASPVVNPILSYGQQLKESVVSPSGQFLPNLPRKTPGTSFSQNLALENKRLAPIYKETIMGATTSPINAVASTLSNKLLSKVVKSSEQEIFEFQNMAKDINMLRPQAQMDLISRGQRLLQKFSPGAAKSKDLQALSKTNLVKWLDYVDKLTTDAVLKVKGPNYNWGFSVKPLLRKETNVANGKLYDAPIYHGTPEKFTKFDTSRSEGGATWFSDSKEEILSGQAGAVQGPGQKLNIMERYIKPGIKLATPKQAEEMFSDQLIGQGYRGVRYPAGEYGDHTWTKLWFPNEDTVTKPIKNVQPKNQMLEDFLSGKINDTVQNRPIASKVDAQAGIGDANVQNIIKRVQGGEIGPGGGGGAMLNKEEVSALGDWAVKNGWQSEMSGKVVKTANNVEDIILGSRTVKDYVSPQGRTEYMVVGKNGAVRIHATPINPKDIIGSVTQNNMTPVGDILASKPQIEVPKTSIVGQTNAQAIIPPKNVTPQEVAAQLPNKVENFVNKVLGYSTETPVGGTKQASGYTKLLRSGQEAITRKVEQGMGSENNLVRNAATTLQNFFRGLGMSPERANASMELRGGMSTANERAFNVMDSLYKSIDHNKGSLERINAVLDPSLSKIKVSLSDLTPQEKQVYGIIREGLDLVHDTSYANGAISKELYLKNQGKYTPRMYDVMELPPEVNKFVTQGKKIGTDLYKSRKELDQWKIDNNLNDPVYALGKRLAQVDTNTAIKKYTDFLASNERFVSNVERPGFTKLSDSPAYGSLSGKYVLNSAAEDLKGFFFANEGMQNLYDVFRAYDRLPIRQLQKKLLTVFNPTTNVGNIVSDQVFGFVTGVDPLTLNKNLIKLKTNPSEFKSLSDYLMRKGITATDITRTDFVNKLGQIDDLASGKKSNMIKILSDKVQSFYGGTDDVYKVSAFKSLLDRGFTTEEAARKVADGFQNYANVGKFYDVWAKTPVVGSTFIKFQGDLMRIIKNGAVNNPLGLITFLGSLYGVAKLSSKLSGETPEDYKTRTERFAAPMIPGLNIPLTWQTPWGEINAARYISPFYANNETTNIAKMLPFVPNIQPNKDVASNIAMNSNDPLLAPFVQLAVNRDFRGKPISDPKENKYQPSTLTPQEKLTNQAVFAGRAYLPPPVNSAIDVGSAIQGKPNMYGTPQTVPQAVARLGGIKISNYGPEEVQKIRDDEAKYQGYANEAIDKQISSVTKGLLQGNVTPEQAMKRIEYLSTKKSEVTQGGVTKINDKVIKVGNEYKYLDDKGDQQTISDFFIPEAPKLTGNIELDKKLMSKYKGKLTAEANDVVKRWELGIIDQGEAEKQLKQIKAIQNSGKKPKKISVKISKPKMVKISKSKPFKPSKSLVNKTPVYKISKARKPKNISIAVGKSKVPAYKIKKFTNTLAGGGTRLA